MGRLTFDDINDPKEAIVKLAEGIPGTVIALAELCKATPIVDPEAALGAMHNLFFLDDLGIYGPNIWVLYKDVCGHDVTKLAAVLRGWQLGIVSRDAISAASVRLPLGAPLPIDPTKILIEVMEQLPKFGRAIP